MMRNLSNLAGVLAEQVQYDEAEALYQRALAIGRKASGPNHPMVVSILKEFAQMYMDAKEYSQADSLFRQSLEGYEQALHSKHPEVGIALSSLANNLILWDEQNVDEALTLVDRSIEIFDETPGYPESKANAYALKAKILKMQGDLQEALAWLTDALAQVERLRPRIGGGADARSGFFGRFKGQFDQMLAWQLEVGRIDKAVEFLERGRARVLLEQLAASKVDLRSQIPVDVRAVLEDREKQVRALMAEYQQRIQVTQARKDLSIGQQKRQLKELESLLRETQAEYQNLHAEIKNASPLWQDLVTSGGKPIPISTIQNSLVPNNGLLLLYNIGSEQSHLFIIPPESDQPEVITLQIEG